jgi:hypothetical protein
MPALVPTEFIGTIAWLGIVPDRDASLAATPVAELMAGFGGVAGEAHGGLTRPSCVRVAAQYKEGTEIRNTRQFSILSAEELATIASEMGLAEFDPAWVGASMVVSGIPDFSHVPPSSRLQGASGATLVVDMQNRPCTFPARVIETAAPGAGKLFKPSAVGRRGVTAWVEREGMFRVGDTIRLHVPDQRAWQSAV